MRTTLSSKQVKDMIIYARSLAGVSYERGADISHGNSLDCSGFTQHIFQQVGIDLPRSSVLQAVEPQGILLVPHSTISYKPGDLLFMSSDRGYYFDEAFAGKHVCVGHTALYIGNGLVIHARQSAGGVIIEKLKDLQKDPHYKTVAVRRYTVARPIYTVPARSQYHAISDLFWKQHSCGIVSLGMVLEFYKKNFKTYDQLLNQGIRMRIRQEGVGWIHAGLARLAQKYGLRGVSYDWYRNSDSDAFLKLTSLLEYGPVIASIYKNLNPKNGGHLIVVTGYTNGHIYYNEPDSHNIKIIRRKVSKDRFVRGWKKRVIWVHS